MNARRVTWLLIAGIAVIVFAIWLSSLRHLERATLAGDLVLPGLERGVNTITSVALRKGDDTHVTLQKQPAQWLVAERGWPAARGKVRKLLLDLSALNVVEEKTRVSANYAQLGVEDVASAKAAGTLVTVASPAQKWALILGKSSGAKSGYVRIPGTDRSLLAAPLVAVEADPKAWLDRALLDVPLERVREIEVHGADGITYTATRQKTDDAHFSIATLPKGRELSGPAAADALGTALSAVTLDDVARAGSTGGPNPKGPRSVFRTFDGLEVEASGRKDGARSWLVLAARSTTPATAAEVEQLNARLSGWEFEIPDYKYAALFVPVEELLKPVPEPGQKPGMPPAPSRH